METEFNTVRYHLASAMTYLVGRDETTARFREALELLVEAVTVAEHRSDPKVVYFPSRPDRP